MHEISGKKTPTLHARLYCFWERKSLSYLRHKFGNYDASKVHFGELHCNLIWIQMLNREIYISDSFFPSIYEQEILNICVIFIFFFFIFSKQNLFISFNNILLFFSNFRFVLKKKRKSPQSQRILDKTIILKQSIVWISSRRRFQFMYQSCGRNNSHDLLIAG